MKIDWIRHVKAAVLFAAIAGVISLGFAYPDAVANIGAGLILALVVGMVYGFCYSVFSADDYDSRGV